MEDNPVEFLSWSQDKDYMEVNIIDQPFQFQLKSCYTKHKVFLRLDSIKRKGYGKQEVIIHSRMMRIISNKIHFWRCS